MALNKKALRAAGVLGPYGATGNDPKDKLTTTQISSAAMSSIGLPTTKLRVKKHTFLIGGAERKLLRDISVVT